MKRSTSDAADTSGMGPPGAKVSRMQGPDGVIDAEFVGLKPLCWLRLSSISMVPEP